MLDFMVIALPRSGTTWAANWLTTDRSLCIHDPLSTLHYHDFDTEITQRANGRLAGISCTAIWGWPDWVNAHPSRKLILHREGREIRNSLHLLGLSLPGNPEELLNKCNGRHCDYRELFNRGTASELWHWLIDLPFDDERHHELVQMAIEPRLLEVRRDSALSMSLGDELCHLRLGLSRRNPFENG